MIILLLMLLTIFSIGIGALLIFINELEKKIDKLERNISCEQYQLDDILCDINCVKNMISTYELPKGGTK